MNGAQKFNYLITFEDDIQIVSHYLWKHNGDEYILAKEYTDESESKELLVLKCLEDGYMEFVKDYDEKCDALVSLANIMESGLVNDAEEAADQSEEAGEIEKDGNKHCAGKNNAQQGHTQLKIRLILSLHGAAPFRVVRSYVITPMRLRQETLDSLRKN